MLKKLTMLAMAVAALAALVVPATASATGKLTEGGSLVAPGSEITLTNDASNPLITETSLGTIECEQVSIPGKVSENSGTSFAGTALAGGTATNCEIVGVGPVEITSPTGSLKSGATGTGTVGLTFIAHIEISGGSVITCHFESEGESGVFHYTTGASTATITPTTLESPACGEAEISGSVNVETTAGGAVNIE